MKDYREYLKSPEWAVVAKQAKKRAGYRCQLCNASGHLHAHHRTYDNLGDELDTDVVVLCRTCHGRFHDKVQSDRDAWLNRVQAERPIFYRLAVAQADMVLLLPSGDILLVFGSTAHDGLLSSFDENLYCDRTIIVAKLMHPTEGLAVVGPDPDEDFVFKKATERLTEAKASV